MAILFCAQTRKWDTASRAVMQDYSAKTTARKDKKRPPLPYTHPSRIRAKETARRPSDNRASIYVPLWFAPMRRCILLRSRRRTRSIRQNNARNIHCNDETRFLRRQTQTAMRPTSFCRRKTNTRQAVCRNNLSKLYRHIRA